MKKILFICGTRPEIIKLAPVYNYFKKQNSSAKWLHTGQHTTISDDIYNYFHIEPDYKILLERKDNSLATLTNVLIDKINQVILQDMPDIVFVHGDTHTAFCGALASFYHKIPVGHIEAGLRSGSIYNPFPEEMNRNLISKIAMWHFAPTIEAKNNLLKENIPEENIIVTGNTVVDAAISILDDDSYFAEFSEFLKNDNYTLVTSHRRENWGKPLENICLAIDEHINRTGHKIVWPVHPNPDLKKQIHHWHEQSKNKNNILLTSPLNYPQFLSLMKNSTLIMTDSGGVQEEAACFNKPIVVLRETTERPEIISCGLGVLSGTEFNGILSAINNVGTLSSIVNPYGDGKASEYIFNHIIGV
jgi:UDP-N-acetylglucosamine 2-epimerase (non-hydrolysing)